MKGIHVAGCAGVAAAAALLAVRWVQPPLPEWTEGPVGRLALAPYGIRDRALPRPRVALSGGVPDGPRHAEPGAPPRNERHEPGEHRGDTGGSSLQLAGGVVRHRTVPDAARNSGPVDSGVTDTALTDDVLAGRSAAVSQPHSNPHDVNPPILPDDGKRHTFEFVDENPKQAAIPDLVLSIPFHGDVKADVGGAAIQFDGLVSNGGTIEFPADAQLSFPAGGTVNSRAGTISFDVQPQWAGADQTNNSLVQIRDENIWENTLELVKNNDALRYIIRDSHGVEYNVNLPIDDWSPGEQQHVTATWSDTQMALYVNGQLVGRTALDNPLAFGDSTPVHIGSDFPGASYGWAGGTISGFKLYGRALDAGEVARS